MLACILPNRPGNAINGFMDVLEQLEVRVSELLHKLEAMQADSDRQQAEMAAAAREKEALVAENEALQQALAQERAWRAEALTRLDALIQAVEEQDSAE
ncbi:cell division protein ZapB [uncultured Desulfovibrio sp.]|uniref:cell division protein ZapB n=1 Tax=uncultured Desulfovibrio sp. TaxID=167968 RepID=UPI002620B88D|nr:cell division protein ZapB [uncultured Desulfovibrio sp.]